MICERHKPLYQVDGQQSLIAPEYECIDIRVDGQPHGSTGVRVDAQMYQCMSGHVDGQTYMWMPKGMTGPTDGKAQEDGSLSNGWCISNSCRRPNAQMTEWVIRRAFVTLIRSDEPSGDLHDLHSAWSMRWARDSKAVMLTHIVQHLHPPSTPKRSCNVMHAQKSLMKSYISV